MWELDCEESWALNWCFWTVVLEKTLESPLDSKEIQPAHPKGNQSWIFIGRTDVEAETPNTLATWCEELTHLKRSWCWERLKARGERDDRGWDVWMAAPTQWIGVWVNTGSCWWTGRPGLLQSMRFQSVRHHWASELNWTEHALHTYTRYLALSNCNPRNFPGGPVTRTLCFQCRNQGSIPVQGIRSHMPQLKVRMLQLKNPTCHSWGAYIAQLKRKERKRSLVLQWRLSPINKSKKFLKYNKT